MLSSDGCYEFSFNKCIVFFSLILDSGFWKDQKRTPFCNLRTSLTYFLDIHSSVSQSLMEALATVATDEKDRKALTHLSKVKIGVELADQN